jgi:uncharacterized membrane protein
MVNKRKFIKKDRTNHKWVACISCGHQYYIEPYELHACTVCDSREYEDADSIPFLVKDDYYDPYR